MRPRRLYTHPHLRAFFACAGLVALACATIAASGAGGATSSLVVDVDIPSATVLDTTACDPGLANITNFGTVTPGSTAMTSLDCDIDFGSTNDSSQLLVGQADDVGTAMGQATVDVTRHSGSSTRLSLVRRTSTHVWVLQTTGGLRRSADGGVTFPLIQSGMGSNHQSLSFPTNAAGWMTGDGSGNIWRTANANVATPTWAVTPTQPAFVARGVAGVSASSAWVVGHGGSIASTADSGATWTPDSFTDAPGGPSAAEDDLYGIDPLDADSFVAWGENGRIIVKRNGAAWADVSLTGATLLQDVDMVTDDHLVVATVNGEIWHTTTANLATPTWTRIRVPTVNDFLEIEMYSTSVGAAVGEEGTLARTFDGGLTWTLETVDASHSMAGLAWIDANTLVAAGAAVRSNDPLTPARPGPT